MKNVILVGLGPHARRIYYPFLEKHQKEFGINILLVVDLESQRNTIQEYLSSKTVQPNKVLYIPDDCRDAEEICDEVKFELDLLSGFYKNLYMIIATEPKDHMVYAEYALEHDINVLMDKPISAPKGLSAYKERSKEIMNDFNTLFALHSRSKSNFVIQCQRRYHEGYKYIESYLKEIVSMFNVPITYMDIYHADGMWNMPDELTYRENHPYKYGYGKLLHSGYHFVDLFTTLNDINQNAFGPLHEDVVARAVRPMDHFDQVSNDFYTTRLHKNFSEQMKVVDKTYGELDVYALLQSKNEAGNVINTTSLALLQNSFSRRSWAALPKDTYKGNGRVRHERFTAQVGPLASIQVHSYQSHEVLKKDLEVSGAGNEDHFDIYFFRNTDLVGGDPFEKISLGEQMKSEATGKYMGHNEKAREKCLLDWLNDKESKSEFSSHRKTNEILSKIYKEIAYE